jgi:hypothetical protein
MRSVLRLRGERRYTPPRAAFTWQIVPRFWGGPEPKALRIMDGPLPYQAGKRGKLQSMLIPLRSLVTLLAPAGTWPAERIRAAPGTLIEWR